jgi:hypothetical protein
MSDTHNEIEKISIPYDDAFVHCGDAVKHRTSVRNLRNFNQFVCQLPHANKRFVSGNCETLFWIVNIDFNLRTLRRLNNHDNRG